MSAENKIDQADALAQLTALKGDTAKLAAPGLSLPANLVEAANSIHGLTKERDDFKGKFQTLTGDKSKLLAGATLPTDLVAAANEIATLKAEKISLDEAVAKKVAALGMVDTKDKKSGSDEGAKKPTLTEKLLAAKGVKSLEELSEKFDANGVAVKS